MADDRPVRDADFRGARIGAAVALSVAVVVMVILDALTPTRDVDPIVLGILLTAVGALLGVELAQGVRGVIGGGK